jgi:phosphoglycerate dehydrogenase-like enzyme
MRVLAATRTPTPDDRGSVDTLVGIDRLDWVMAESDYAVVATPLTPETRGLIGARQLGLLGSGGFLINVARGPIVDERALYQALRDRTIAGASIDTWYRYPSTPDERSPVGSLPFSELDNLLMTPHVAGWTVPTMVRRWEIIADNIKRVARGEEPINVVYRAP